MYSFIQSNGPLSGISTTFPFVAAVDWLLRFGLFPLSKTMETHYPSRQFSIVLLVALCSSRNGVSKV